MQTINITPLLLISRYTQNMTATMTAHEINTERKPISIAEKRQYNISKYKY